MRDRWSQRPRALPPGVLRSSVVFAWKKGSARKLSIGTLSAALMMSLSGCSTPRSPEIPVRLPPAAAMVECSRPSPLVDPSLAGLLRKSLELADALDDCRARHNELMEWVQP